MCTEAIYQPIVFLIEPYSLRGLIQFGNINGTENDCSNAKSKIKFEIYGDVLPTEKSVYKMNDESVCPRELLKFDPPAQNRRCNRNFFRQMTKINEIGLNFTFQNVSARSFYPQSNNPTIDLLFLTNFFFRVYSLRNGLKTA